MCILAVADKAFPSLETLQRMEAHNPDGGGIAWLEGDQVRWIKGINAEQMAQLNYLPLPVVLHFRMATVGGKSKKLCHPFPATKEAEVALSGVAPAVVFHNGHWEGWEEMLKFSLRVAHTNRPNGPWSDTRALACIAGLGGKRCLSLVGVEKVIHFSAKGIRYFGDFTRDEETGLLVSNDYWKWDKFARCDFSAWSVGDGDWSDLPIETGGEAYGHSRYRMFKGQRIYRGAGGKHYDEEGHIVNVDETKTLDEIVNTPAPTRVIYLDPAQQALADAEDKREKSWMEMTADEQEALLASVREKMEALP